MSYSIQSKIFFFLLSAFTASLIIFDLSVNVIYSNILNIILFIFFGISFLMNKDLKFQINNFILIYFFFTAFSLSSIFWAVDFDLAFIYSMRLVVVSLNLFIIYTIITYYKIQNAILYGILIGAFFNYLLAFNIIHVNYDLYEFGRFIGSEGNSNKLSKIMLLSIFASLVLLSFEKTNKVFKVYLIISILLSLYVIFLTVSKKAIILAPLLLLASISFQNINIKKIFIFFIIIAIAIKIFFTFVDFSSIDKAIDVFHRRFQGFLNMLEGKQGDDSSNERIYLLKEGFVIFQDSPIFGTGLNNFRVFLGKYAHNNYLELLVDVGFIGTLLFYGIYVILFQGVTKMHNIVLRKYIFIMIIILLLMDIATVSYYNKLVLLILLYIFFMIKQNQEMDAYE